MTELDSVVTAPGPRRRWSLGQLLRSPLLRSGKARTGLALIALFVLVALLAPVLAPFDPNASLFIPYQGPSAAHWLGTTGTGQDVLSQFLWGTRASLTVALVAGALTTFIAVAVGILSGLVGGLVDDLLSFVTNVFLVVPALPLMVVLAAYIKIQGLTPIVFVITITSWSWGARVIRSQVVSLRNRDYVLAARLSGDSTAHIVTSEVLPNLLSLVSATFLNASISAVLAESGLEFLGLGDPNVVSWGTMLYWANNGNALLNGQWAWLLVPGLAIALLGASFALINFGVDEITNPRLRRRSAA